MFTPAHAALGALTERGFQGRKRGMAATAAVGIVLHAMTEDPSLWHAPYRWPPDTPAILHFLPYPHDAVSSLWLGLVLVLTALTLFLLRRFWWGMLWANAPDIVDWVILWPLWGSSWIHDCAFPYLYAIWGGPLELLVVATIVLMLWQARSIRGG